jgi:hypothetical protein
MIRSSGLIMGAYARECSGGKRMSTASPHKVPAGNCHVKAVRVLLVLRGTGGLSTPLLRHHTKSRTGVYKAAKRELITPKATSALCAVILKATSRKVTMLRSHFPRIARRKPRSLRQLVMETCVDRKCQSAARSIARKDAVLPADRIRDAPDYSDLVQVLAEVRLNRLGSAPKK